MSNGSVIAVSSGLRFSGVGNGGLSPDEDVGLGCGRVNHLEHGQVHVDDESVVRGGGESVQDSVEDVDVLQGHHRQLFLAGKRIKKEALKVVSG